MAQVLLFSILAYGDSLDKALSLKVTSLCYTQIFNVCFSQET